MGKRTKTGETILRVLDHARATQLPLPEAVESYRKTLREAMRRHRAWASTLRTPMARGMVERGVARNRLESSRVRRLQRRFASWQSPVTQHVTQGK